MNRKKLRLGRKALGRSLSVSLAGLRAGSALAVDSALQKVRGGDGDSALAKREAERFVAELGRQKGTYVKIGQMMALFGEHFLPPVLAEALHQLHNQTDSVPFSDIEPVLKLALGDRYMELDIDRKAAAAASLAQVHRARVKSTGEEICLKVQYPGLADMIDADFDAVVRLLTVARWVKAGRELDEWLESLRDHLHHEVDYRREADMTQRMAKCVAAIQEPLITYQVPAVYERYCGESVLALEWVSGWSVNHEDVKRLSLARRNALAEGMLDLFFYELYDWGLMQTDPNFGNYLLKLDDRRKREGRDDLVLLDFGSVLECDERFLFELGRVIEAGLARDVDGVAEGLIGLECLPADACGEARRLFAEFCFHLLEPLQNPDQLPVEYLNDDGQYCWRHSALMRRASKLGVKSAASGYFTPPSRDFALIVRKLSGVFTFIAVLDAQFNAAERVNWHLQRWRKKTT